MISIDRSLLQSCFVRLACVRHAASVHPEPGSNSQKILYLNIPFGLLKPYFSIAYSALKRIFYFSLFLLRPFCKEPIFGALLPLGNSLLFVLFCSIFKVHRPASLEASLINIPREPVDVNTFIQKMKKFFKTPQSIDISGFSRLLPLYFYDLYAVLRQKSGTFLQRKRRPRRGRPLYGYVLLCRRGQA